MRKAPHTILLSRTDAIGDVILTLPMAGILKELFPESKIIFLGMSYTKPIIERCKFVDDVICWNEILLLEKNERIIFLENLNIDVFIHVFPRKEIAYLAKKANIPIKTGTTGRIYNWLYCNSLIPLSRKKSDLHEAQLNIKLIEKLGAQKKYSLNSLSQYYGFQKKSDDNNISHIPDKEKFNLILHPKSKGSAREWGLNNFERLINILPSEKFNIIISGTADEGKLISELLNNNAAKITDLTGKLTLDQLITLTDICDGLVAASTGPLHIAAMTGSFALGIYPPIRPMHPGRWAPIGKDAHFLVKEKTCDICRKNNECSCIREITPEQVYSSIISSSIYKVKFGGKIDN